jgi:hypothetical protein
MADYPSGCSKRMRRSGATAPALGKCSKRLQGSFATRASLSTHPLRSLETNRISACQIARYLRFGKTPIECFTLQSTPSPGETFPLSMNNCTSCLPCAGRRDNSAHWKRRREARSRRPDNVSQAPPAQGIFHPCCVGGKIGSISRGLKLTALCLDNGVKVRLVCCAAAATLEDSPLLNGKHHMMNIGFHLGGRLQVHRLGTDRT